MSPNNLEFTGASKKGADQTGLFSPVLQGREMAGNEFKDWIEQAESKPTISLQEAKNKWASKRKHLQSNIK